MRLHKYRVAAILRRRDSIRQLLCLQIEIVMQLCESSRYAAKLHAHAFSLDLCKVDEDECLQAVHLIGLML